MSCTHVVYARRVRTCHVHARVQARVQTHVQARAQACTDTRTDLCARTHVQTYLDVAERKRPVTDERPALASQHGEAAMGRLCRGCV